MNIEAALKLKKSKDLLRAAKDAEARNCEQKVIRKLYELYYNALEREQNLRK